jgi:hypothetical protein
MLFTNIGCGNTELNLFVATVRFDTLLMTLCICKFTDAFFIFLTFLEIPLSSDAWSGFGRDNFKVHNEEVSQASLYLKNVTLKQFSDDLKSRFVDCNSGKLKGRSCLK